MKVITLTGKDGGKMAGTADIEIRVPHFGYADRIQEIHIKVIHILIQLIEKRWLNKPIILPVLSGLERVGPISEAPLALCRMATQASYPAYELCFAGLIRQLTVLR